MLRLAPKTGPSGSRADGGVNRSQIKGTKTTYERTGPSVSVSLEPRLRDDGGLKKKKQWQ